ncbi:uncharacterized protein BCR38DRAFT_336709 [Pseudomassariella vexata]|uniref:Indole-diterpene biosynthesis protein PaxU n=1 Tax=Pseudomassariella vexata TaxID=1141098 RepID=A0A1Y2E8P7_9PEZI|nr:uncharacterized protein BCR38DRAFT_336709 [Pseudomassariella vexata]ORY67807.1 hypothetical protein BCR38DRAFT_336709 [Pseudomassariella vexata]
MGNESLKSRPFIPGFSCLAPSIYIQEAQQTPEYVPSNYAKSTYSDTSAYTAVTTATTRRIDGSPDLILLTSWTGALPKHISKYTAAYTEMYPYSPIMVITTSIDDLTLRSTEQKTTAIAPAIGFIQGRTGRYDSKILLHAFSEGGSNKAVCLAKAYLQCTGHVIPIGAYIFDSTPGTPRFNQNVAAFRRSLPLNPIIRFFGMIFGFLVLSLTWTIFCVFIGYENNTITKTRRALNDESLWPLKGVPRTYVFSEADDLIWWKDVEEHAEMSAQDLGVTSLVVRYKKSGHCGHVRENEAYYWSAVRQTWEGRDVEVGGGIVDARRDNWRGEWCNMI